VSFISFTLWFPKLDEVISLYQADKCSLARAVELANLSRWELIDVLKNRCIPITIETKFTAAEMDAIEKDLEHEGILCLSSAMLKTLAIILPPN
jgi:predicted HTH domain antitoxin